MGAGGVGAPRSCGAEDGVALSVAFLLLGPSAARVQWGWAMGRRGREVWGQEKNEDEGRKELENGWWADVKSNVGRVMMEGEV